MSLLDILLLGVALSADAFAVTISNTFVYARERRFRLLLMPIFFGVFQALMPVLGYVLGGLAAQLIQTYAGIVTLLILGIIGCNMVREGVGALREGVGALREGGGQPDGSTTDAGTDAGGTDAGPTDGGTDASTVKRLTISQLVMQAIATAIDAFAVGISLRAEAVSLPLAVSVIGLTTFALCLVALFVGRRLGSLLGDRAEVVGGVVLIGIGVKSFLGL